VRLGALGNRLAQLNLVGPRRSAEPSDLVDVTCIDASAVSQLAHKHGRRYARERRAEASRLARRTTFHANAPTPTATAMAATVRHARLEERRRESGGERWATTRVIVSDRRPVQPIVV
jgi:hypothetical protein